MAFWFGLWLGFLLFMYLVFRWVRSRAGGVRTVQARWDTEHPIRVERRSPTFGKRYEYIREKLLRTVDSTPGCSRETTAEIVREWEGLIHPPYLSRLQFAHWLTARWMDHYVSGGQRSLPTGFPSRVEVLPRLVQSSPLLHRMLGTMRLHLEEGEGAPAAPWSRVSGKVTSLATDMGFLSPGVNPPWGAWTQGFMRFLYTCGTLWEAQVMARKAEEWMVRTGADTFSYADFPAEPWDLEAVANLALRLLWGGADDWASVGRVEADHGFWERVCRRTFLRGDKLARMCTIYFDRSFPASVFYAYDFLRMNREEPRIPILGQPWSAISGSVFQPLVLIYARRREDPSQGRVEAGGVEDLLAHRTLGRLFSTDLLSLPPLEVVWDEAGWPPVSDPRNEPEWQEQNWIDWIASLPVHKR